MDQKEDPVDDPNIDRSELEARKELNRLMQAKLDKLRQIFRNAMERGSFNDEETKYLNDFVNEPNQPMKRQDNHG